MGKGCKAQDLPPFQNPFSFNNEAKFQSTDYWVKSGIHLLNDGQWVGDLRESPLAKNACQASEEGLWTSLLSQANPASRNKHRPNTKGRRGPPRDIGHLKSCCQEEGA